MSYRDLADLNIVNGPSAAARGARRAEAKVVRKPTAVLVDDSEVTRNLLVRILESTPLDIVATAGSARDALRLTSKLHPDVVIVDVLVPGVRDNGTLSELRQLYPSVKIVLSTTQTRKTSGAASPAEADAYILRPYHRDRVRERVTNLCRNLPLQS